MSLFIEDQKIDHWHDHFNIAFFGACVEVQSMVGFRKLPKLGCILNLFEVEEIMSL